MVFVDARPREPAAKLRAGAAAEGKAGRELDRARRLPNDRDPIADRARDDGPRLVDEAGVHAAGAAADAGLEADEGDSVQVWSH
jgi:hypothetical protein